MRLRRAVPEIPAKIPVPPGLPLNKSRSLLTHSESTLPQPLIPLHSISFSSNVYKKTGEGPARPSSIVLQLVTTNLPVLRTHTNTRNPNPLYALIHNSRDARGVGGDAPLNGTANPACRSSTFRASRSAGHGSRAKGNGSRNTGHGPRPLWSPGTVAPQPAKCQNHASCSRWHRRQETYPLRSVSNVLRADIGHGKPQRRPGSKSIPARRTGIALARRPGSTVLR